MKKLFFILPLLLNANFAFGYIVEDFPNGCNSFNNNMRAVFQPFEYTCANGYFLPADTLGCTVCPINATCSGGTYQYNETFEQGITRETIMTQNQTNACSYGYKNMSAIFKINQYDCAPGYYLPANTDGCVICPADSYCVGGTYTFDETTAQGITACPDGKISDAGSDDVSDCRAPAINCSPGYYLPANATECVVCPGDSYCGGGTYTFNETLAQGIVSCSTGLFAPSGMWEAAQCGRILHVGDGFVYLRATKKTSPSLHLDLDHDGVADYFGNMTTLDVPMSRGTQRKLKVRYNNTTYSIYDDSVELPSE